MGTYHVSGKVALVGTRGGRAGPGELFAIIYPDTDVELPLLERKVMATRERSTIVRLKS